MIRILRRRSLAGLLPGLCASSLFFAQSRPLLLAQSAYETAVRALVDRYFTAYPKEDFGVALHFLDFRHIIQSRR